MFNIYYNLVNATNFIKTKIISILKLDTLQNCHKTILAIIDVDGKWYYNKDATHNKNERSILVKVKNLSTTLFNLEVM
jgi:hypothetical protein